MEKVGSVGNLSEGCERADDDEATRSATIYEKLTAKVVSYSTNRTEQTRGGQKEMYVPQEVYHVSGGEQEEKDWEDVDELRQGSVCYNCEIVEGKGMARGKAETDGGKEYAKREGKNNERYGERKVQAH